MPQEHCNVVDSVDGVESGTDYIDCNEDDLQHQKELKKEQVRLDTFSDWSDSLPVTPRELAKNGFYSLKTDDRVKCIFCNLVLKNWEPGDIVTEEHKKFNPCCAFLLKRNVGNIPIEPEPGASPGTGRGSRVPRFAEYSKPAAREGTYCNIPETMTQSTDDLVEAGFFYMGQDDCVRCFHCGVLIRNWEIGDDPWTEHRHWSPNCEYLKSRPESKEQYEVTPVMRRVLDMGYEQELVKNVVQRNRRSGADEITDINILVDAVEKLRCQQKTVSRAHGLPVQESSGAEMCTSSGASSLEDEYRQMKDQRLCKICMVRDVEITFTPCGHLAVCEKCGQPLKKCPICRRLIKSYVKTYMS
ncbi:Baculoviral IAP repeat-containing [Mactra antiquata]